MRWTMLALCICSFARTALAQSTPYAAIIQADNVEVRSGPGSRYYVTSRLPRGSEVTVHRHDPGGWYMIAPPPGSFSYIRAEHVQVNGQTGTVNVPSFENGIPAQAIVRIGSAFGPEHDYYGRQLATGDQVQILGRVTLPADQGPVEMLKIAPPRGEFRWVKGDFVVPKSAKSSGGPDPFKSDGSDDGLIPFGSALIAETGSPSSSPWGEPAPSENTGVLEREVIRGIKANAVNRTGPTPEQLVAERERLDAIDGRFRDMITNEPGTWRLEELERDYRALHEQASTDAMKAKIDLRFAAIDRRREVLRKYEEFIRLTSETSHRDAELLRLQQQRQANISAATLETDLGQATPMTPPAEQAESISPPPSSKRSLPKLDGAGIVQQATTRFPGSPRHVLIAPDGRILSYLEPGSLTNIENYVGREMGVIGNRRFETRLQGDLITVDRLIPIRLRR